MHVSSGVSVINIFGYFILLEVSSYPTVYIKSVLLLAVASEYSVSLVYTGCPATWKTWQRQGISMQGEKVMEFLENKRSQEKVSEFIFSQSERPNFETFLGKPPPRPPLIVLDAHENFYS